MRITFQDEGQLLKDLDLEEAAKKVARRQLRSPTLQEILSRWWENKYKLPSNHELFQSNTLFALLKEFWLDRYHESPIEASRLPDGRVQFKDTGDDMVDKWEQELIDGIVPDYMEAFSPEQLEKLKLLRTRGKTAFGHSAARPTQTLKGTVDSVSAEAARKGLGPPSPFPYNSRFRDVGIPEE